MSIQDWSESESESESESKSEKAEHTTQYMKRSLADIRGLAHAMGLDTQRMSQCDLVAEIVAHSGRLRQHDPHLVSAGCSSLRDPGRSAQGAKGGIERD